ncbi:MULTISPECIES: HIT family protein [unclassified Brevundimonas]|uniref:HIT family protein n=1 Tax=unclassified Brevundimonas TaxID=2622653 RepID=UPI0025BFB649|nr:MULTISPECIES: HIT family protein [unclassified Brevundimonas]
MSLHGSYDSENVFARILRGQIPSVPVWEDDKVYVFMDAFPQSEGHTLVISKTSQARNILEIEAPALNDITAAVQRTARAIEKALSPDGLIVTQFNGAPAGQTVFHLHFHIIPRWENRNMAGHGQSGMADPEQLKATAQRIRAALD